MSATAAHCDQGVSPQALSNFICCALPKLGHPRGPAALRCKTCCRSCATLVVRRYVAGCILRLLAPLPMPSRRPVTHSVRHGITTKNHSRLLHTVPAATCTQFRHPCPTVPYKRFSTSCLAHATPPRKLAPTGPGGRWPAQGVCCGGPSDSPLGGSTGASERDFLDELDAHASCSSDHTPQWHRNLVCRVTKC